MNRKCLLLLLLLTLIFFSGCSPETYSYHSIWTDVYHEQAPYADSLADLKID